MQSHRRKAFWGIVILGILLAQIYTSIVDGFDDIIPFVNTAIMGALIGISVFLFEYNLNRIINKKFSFILTLIIRSAYYFTISFTVIFFQTILAKMVRQKASFNMILQSEEFHHYLYNEDFSYGILTALGLILIFNFTRQMNSKLGQNVLLSFITGRYVTPVTQDRIFMFIKVVFPDPLLEIKDGIIYFKLLNDIIYEISEVVLLYHGEIYEYTDEYIIISWKPEHGVKNDNCIKSCFLITETIERKKQVYVEKYAISTDLNIALHFGKAVRGEMGDVKSTLVFSGDVLNVTSRILEKCTELNSPVIISEFLLNLLNLPDAYCTTDHGKVSIRGKKDKISLYSLSLRNNNSGTT